MNPEGRNEIVGVSTQDMDRSYKEDIPKYRKTLARANVITVSPERLDTNSTNLLER